MNLEKKKYINNKPWKIALGQNQKVQLFGKTVLGEEKSHGSGWGGGY